MHTHLHSLTFSLHCFLLWASKAFSGFGVFNSIFICWCLWDWMYILLLTTGDFSGANCIGTCCIFLDDYQSCPRMMRNCPQCKNDFPCLHETTDVCRKCRALKPGMSTAEYTLINVCFPVWWNSSFWQHQNLENKPQYSRCGLLSANLKHPICNGCITYYSTFIDSTWLEN